MKRRCGKGQPTIHMQHFVSMFSGKQVKFIKRLVAGWKNILISGRTGSGKTTVLNAILEMAVKRDPEDHICVIYDLPGVVCSGVNCQFYSIEAENAGCVGHTDDDSLYPIINMLQRQQPGRIVICYNRDANEKHCCTQTM